MSRGLQILRTALAPLLFVAVLFVLYREMRYLHYAEVTAALEQLGGDQMLQALALTVVSYVVLMGYDLAGMVYARARLPWHRVVLTSLVAYALSNNVGLGGLAGAPVRFRLFSTWGVPAQAITRVVAFGMVTFWIGYALLGGVVFAWSGWAPARVLPDVPLGALGVGLLAALGAYLLWVLAWPRPLAVLGWRFAPPAPRLVALQLLLGSADWLLAGAVLYVMLPVPPSVPFLALLQAYLMAQLAGLASQVPGGLGVFEASMVLLIGRAVPEAALISSLLAYRVIYYLVPLGAAALVLGLLELAARWQDWVPATRALDEWAQIVVPPVFAAVTFVGGVVLLLSGATPAVALRLMFLRSVVPLPILEVSHFLGSLAGLGLVLLAVGIYRRLDAAYFLVLALLAAGSLFSLLKGADFEEAFILAVFFLLLLPMRRFFFRRAAVLGELFSPGWTLAVALSVASAAWLGWFSFHHQEISQEVWWEFSFRGDAPRALRALVGVATAALFVAGSRLVLPARRQLPQATAEEIEQAFALASRSPDTRAYLAALGDKTLLFDRERTAFIMYATEGRSWVAMGDPVGPEPVCRKLAHRFREQCHRQGSWSVFYQVRPANLPLYLDLGLSLMKLGEEARVPLEGFSLEGSSRKGLRSVRNRLEREGCRVEILAPAQGQALLPELRRISDAWLAEKQTAEKGFSLGFFQEDYLRRFPIAVVRQQERILAFANLWLGAGREELSVDLMRHRPEAPEGVMDYLFARLMLYGREQGYRWFNMGMAPLSGMDSYPLAPMWNRLGNLVYRYGDYLYSFRGLRQYKDKFDPLWEPRYLASPGGLALPNVLADLANLIAGGWRGLFFR